MLFSYLRYVIAIVFIALFSSCFADYSGIPFGTGELSQLEKDYLEGKFAKNDDEAFEVNLLDFENSIKFRSHDIIECFKFLFYGFGEKYFFKITISPHYQLDPENKKPYASMVFFHYSF